MLVFRNTLIQLLYLSNTFLNNSLFLISNTAIEVQGGGDLDNIVNELANLVKPYFEKDILNFLAENMKTALEEALVDFDIREIFEP
jgi:hypothetical protein